MRVAAPLGPFSGRVSTSDLTDKVYKFKLKFRREGLGSIADILNNYMYCKKALQFNKKEEKISEKNTL